ncbi:MAG TPA: hypothetical protein PLM89_10525 [Anaerolineales bacterium]|nr:hypothetical protein [Anaerolineales bacterium]
MSIVKHAPMLTLEEAANLAERLYGARGTLRPLPSERDQNFLLDAGEARYVLKIANAMEERALLVAQNEARRWLEIVAANHPIDARGGN